MERVKTFLLRLLNLIFPSERASETELISIGYQQAMHDIARKETRQGERVQHQAAYEPPKRPLSATMTLPTKLATMRARMHANERRFRQALTNDKANTQHLPAVQVAQARVLQQQPRFRPTDMEAMRGATHSGAFASDRADAWINEPGVDETKRRLRSVRLEAMR